jgi:3-deoxy-manno-octulosonate cytidylyltransferase (CMP-KDO synthetase)
LLEEIEDIEILRFLELGYDVKMIELSKDSVAVDVSEDIEKVISRLKNG